MKTRSLARIPLVFVVMMSACDNGPKSLTLNKHYLVMDIGDTFQLSVSENVNNVSYISSDDSLASVTNNGLITALEAGEVTITASYRSLKDECLLKINEGSAPIVTQIKRTTGNVSIEYENAEYGSFSLKAPVSSDYNAKSTFVDTDNFKMDFISHLFEGEDSQIKENVKTLALLTNTEETAEYLNIEVDIPLLEEADQNLINYGHSVLEIYKEMEDLSDEELHTYILSLKDEVFYSYLKEDYQGMAFLRDNTALYYKYNKGESEILNTLIEALSYLSDFNLSDLDLSNFGNNDDSEITDSESEPSIIEELISEGIDFNMQLISLSETRYNFSLNERGLEIVNDYLKEQVENPDELEELTALSFYIIVKRSLFDSTIEEVGLTVGVDSGSLSLSLEIENTEIIEDENAFIYENRHSEFERILED